MWKNLIKSGPLLVKEALFLKAESLFQQQLRTTYILKRRVPPYYHKQGSLPKRLRNRHFIYELVKDTDREKAPDMEVILSSYVEGLGNIGDRVAVRPNYAYNHLLLTGLAVYASPENIEKYREYENKNVEQNVHSSATSQRVVNCLSRLTLPVVMNLENTWTLQPWHIRANFRKTGFWVPEDTITMPTKPIKGPNKELEGKDFYVTITVNNMEKVNVRCKIHHWSTDVTEKLPYVHEYWKEPPNPIFVEDLEILKSLPSSQLSEVSTVHA